MPDIIHRTIEEDKLRDILLDEFEPGIAAEMRDVVHAAGDEIVQANDFVPAREEQISQVRAKKSGGAGHYGGWLAGFHQVSNCMNRGAQG